MQWITQNKNNAKIIDLIKFKLVIRTHLTSQHVRLFEMASVHFWRFTGHRFDFDANFLTFASCFDLLVITFDRCDYTDVQKLKDNGK